MVSLIRGNGKQQQPQPQNDLAEREIRTVVARGWERTAWAGADSGLENEGAEEMAQGSLLQSSQSSVPSTYMAATTICNPRSRGSEPFF